MDKRTKILLIVLAALILVGGGIFGYMYMTAEKPAPAPLPVAARQKQKTKKPAAKAPVTVTPVPAKAPAPATAKAPVAPAPAKTPAPATAKAPVAAAPGKAPAPGKAKAPAAPAPGKAPAPATAKAPAAAAPAKAAAPYVPVLKLIEKGRQVQYKSPEDFLARTSMSPDEMRAFAKKGAAEAKKTYDALQKGKAAKDALDRAGKDLKMMEKLTALVNAKYPEEPEKVYTYSSLGKRDPFMSPLEVPKALPKVTPGMSPLEKSPTETLVLKAVLWTHKGFRAMIETPDNRAYTVKSGDLVGNKGGRITKITERNVYVTENITDILGDVETRNIVLKLHKEAE